MFLSAKFGSPFLSDAETTVAKDATITVNGSMALPSTRLN